MVGFSASSKSSVSLASVALEQISVDPATNVASRPNANPPIQKNGELQNSLSSAAKPRIMLRFFWCPRRAACVCTTPFGVPVEPEV